MKFAVTFLFLICLATAEFGQTKPCALTLKDSPEIRGIKLGMTRAQFAQRINRSSVGNFIFLYKSDLEKIEDFENVAELNAIFNSRNLLDSFVVKYDENAVSWKDAREFARNLSGNLKLPLASWSYFPTENREAILNCRDFYMGIYAPLNQVIVKSLVQEGQPAATQTRTNEDAPNKAFKP